MELRKQEKSNNNNKKEEEICLLRIVFWRRKKNLHTPYTQIRFFEQRCLLSHTILIHFLVHFIYSDTIARARCDSPSSSSFYFFLFLDNHFLSSYSNLVFIKCFFSAVADTVVCFFFFLSILITNTKIYDTKVGFQMISWFA